MHYRCFNCDVDVDIIDVTTSPTYATTCPNCFTNLHLEIYKQCQQCKVYYLYTSITCLNCGESNQKELPHIPKPNYEYIDSVQKYRNAINILNNLDHISLDTETNGLDPFECKLLLIQLGDQEIAYIFDYHWHALLKKEYFWKNPKKLFLIHNAKFDYKILKQKLNISIKNIFDTMIAERILTCGVSRKISLKDVVYKYLKSTLLKEIREQFLVSDNRTLQITKDILEYASLDVQVLPLIYEIQSKRILSEGLSKIAKLEFDLVKVIAEMELRGINLDVHNWNRIIRECLKRKAAILKKIQGLLSKTNYSSNLFGEVSINLNSTQHLKQLFKHFGIEIESTQDEVIAQIDHPLAAFIREYRKYEKQLNSFGENVIQCIHNETGRLHPTFQQIGADTGRFSCNKPNLQQIPAIEEYRKCFSAPKGRKIVTCDYSQQELRILASLSGDPKFIKMYKDNLDLHSATASMMFNIPIEKVEKENHRKVAKTINFGLAYGQGPKALGASIGVDETKAKEMIKKYFEQFGNIKQWLENAAKDAQEKGYSRTLLGRKRYYEIPNKLDREHFQKMGAIGRKGKNTPIQGSAVDMMKIALIRIDKELKKKKLDAFIINTVHDEIVLETSEKDAQMAAIIVEKSMVQAGEAIAPDVPIIAEAHIGKYWEH